MGQERDRADRFARCACNGALGLPKTRSGKIMRRILRKIAENEFGSLGDISTLADPNVVRISSTTASIEVSRRRPERPVGDGQLSPVPACPGAEIAEQLVGRTRVAPRASRH